MVQTKKTGKRMHTGKVNSAATGKKPAKPEMKN